MDVVGKIIKGKYFDSVSLMQVSKKINLTKGVKDSSIVMGTHENCSILKAANLFIPLFENCNDNDLLVAIKGDREEIQKVLNNVETILEDLKKRSKESNGESGRKPRDIESATHLLKNPQLALISIAGKYAAAEADKALDQNLNVMIFSDNISLEDEIKLKQKAKSKNLIVMGPDCGTAIISGVPLAFANVVERGDIGIVAASGTGLQEVSTLISNNGGGISHAIGTGGRDIKKEVGGISFLQGIKLLGNDQSTRKIVLVSKPPHPDVVKEIKSEIKKYGKETYALFIGFDANENVKKEFEKSNIFLANDLYELSMLTLGKKADHHFDSKLLNHNKEKIKGKKYIRALFSGGTFAAETQIILSEYPHLKNEIRSNVPLKDIKKVSNLHKSELHTIIDLGDDDFTVGRPHPMIDFSTRVRRIEEDANSPDTAVILLDIVLGYGSNMDPLSEVMPVLTKIKDKCLVVASVTGTIHDPQHRMKVVEGLQHGGVLVFNSNAVASRFCAELLKN